jgi:head-tail adaptor
MAGIGQWLPIKIEKWTQGKNAAGSNAETYIQGWTVHADVVKQSQLSYGRSYERGQTKLTDSYKMRIRKSGIDIKALYKVVFKGKRFTVTSIDEVDKFYIEITLEAK